MTKKHELQTGRTSKESMASSLLAVVIGTTALTGVLSHNNAEGLHDQAVFAQRDGDHVQADRLWSEADREAIKVVYAVGVGVGGATGAVALGLQRAASRRREEELLDQLAAVSESDSEEPSE